MKINKDILKNILLSTLTVILSVAVVATIIRAATDLTVPGGALSGGTPVASMHTLEDIYHKLTNTALDPAHTLNPSAGPAGTMHTVEDLYNAANDANLLAENIKDGITIFGVEGSYTASAPTLTWTTEPEQGFMTWNNAKTYCANMEPVHRLPTTSEIVVAMRAQFVYGIETNVGSFRSGVNYWAEEVEGGPTWAWHMAWGNGFSIYGVAKNDGGTTLRCVR